MVMVTAQVHKGRHIVRVRCDTGWLSVAGARGPLLAPMVNQRQVSAHCSLSPRGGTGAARSEGAHPVSPHSPSCGCCGRDTACAIVRM